MAGTRGCRQSATAAAQQRFESIRHEIVGMTTGRWGGDVVAIEVRVHYLRNGREIVLPVTSTLRRRLPAEVQVLAEVSFPSAPSLEIGDQHG